MDATNEQIDRNELLASTRAVFVSTFAAGLEDVLRQSADSLLSKAERSPTAQGQRRIMDARGVIEKKSFDIKAQMKKALEKLLHRSFQTTYSNYRPSFSDSIMDASISLIDTTAFEDELRFNSITERFRNEAGEQLRDLNIRIALIFEQDNISERENPFRPYLFSRSILKAVESIDAPPELHSMLTDQLAEDFVSQVNVIYGAVNDLLTENGIAVQLKPKRSPELRRARSDGADGFANSAFPAFGQPGDSQADAGYANAHHDSAAVAFPHQAPAGPEGRAQPRAMQGNAVERLFHSVRAMASRPFRGGGQAGGDAQQVAPQDDGGRSGSYGAPPGPGAQDGMGANQVGGPRAGSGLAHGAGHVAYHGADATAPGHADGTGWAAGNAGSQTGAAMASAGAYGASGVAGHGGGPGTHSIAAGSGAQGQAFPGDQGGHGGQAGGGSAGSGRPSWLSGRKAVGDVLRRFFAGNSVPDDFEDFDDAGEGEPAPLRAAPGLLAGTVQRLIRHSTPATGDMYSENGEIRNLIMERRSGLAEVANNMKEQMTIDIVSMLFEFILRDTQVPAEVRAQLGRLQFLVLKIALRDESLLTTKAHPARMLVNRIGSISLGLKQIDPSGVAVTEEICRIVEAILADETENPNLFLKMLDDLDTFIARELLTQEKGVATAVEAVEHAESRTLRLAHTSAQVSEALLGLNINEHLRDFLENDWARAIEYAERNTPAIAAEYRALIPDLLWSVLPKVNESDRMQLLALLPPILKTIHGGMEPIGWPAANKQTLMDWLFDAHTLVLRGNSATPAPITFSAIHAHFQKFVDNPEAVQPSTPGKVSPAAGKGYLEDAMRELDARINMLDHFFDDDAELQSQMKAQDDADAAAAAAQGAEPAVEAEPADIAERLRVGIAIEVNLGGKPSVGRLNWINQKVSNMVLTLADQSEPSMISVRMFQRLLRNDRVRFLEDEPVFERAVESLLAAAEA